MIKKKDECLNIKKTEKSHDKKYFKTSDEVQVLVVAVALRFPGTRIWEAPQNTSQNSNFCLASAQDELDYNNCGNKHNKNMSETPFSVSI